jgi:hypothetical protein
MRVATITSDAPSAVATFPPWSSSDRARRRLGAALSLSIVFPLAATGSASGFFFDFEVTARTSRVARRVKVSSSRRNVHRTEDTSVHWT